MTWVSRLTLIAYLVGGWLLPAAHFHAHHDHAVCHNDVASHASATCEDAESDDHQSHCCGHSDRCETASDAPARQIGKHFSEAQPHPVCNGLCALCSARTLTSTTLKQAVNQFGLCDGSQGVIYFYPPLLPHAPASEHFSRGPPEIV